VESAVSVEPTLDPALLEPITAEPTAYRQWHQPKLSSVSTYLTESPVSTAAPIAPIAPTPVLVPVPALSPRALRTSSPESALWDTPDEKSGRWGHQRTHILPLSASLSLPTLSPPTLYWSLARRTRLSISNSFKAYFIAASVSALVALFALRTQTHLFCFSCYRVGEQRKISQL
jgi:hypothetical protein